MNKKLSIFIDRLISFLPGMITVAIYSVMVMILADYEISILLLIGGLLLGLIFSAMDVNFLPLRPLMIMYTIASVASFFFIAYKKEGVELGSVDMLVILFFIVTILIMVLIGLTRPDNPSTYILKVIIDWYGVVLLFVFLFSLYYFVCEALVGADGVTPQNKLQTCCYFSCVTFTGLGYGDVVALPEFRMVAAMQTIIGYICMGGVAATIYSLIQSKLQIIHKAKRLEEKAKAEQEEND
jgi:hypothetical protein